MSDYDYDEFLKDSSDDYPKYADGLSPRRGDRVADCAALEMPSCGNATAGSNPALSAIGRGPRWWSGPRDREIVNPARSGRKQR